MVLTAVGLLFCAVEVAVTTAADAIESTTAAAPLLALWGAGSLAGGLLAARRSRAGRPQPCSRRLYERRHWSRPSQS